MKLPTRAGMPTLVTTVAVSLSATCLALLPTTSASAAGLDPTPPTQASTWLKGQLQGNLLRSGVAATSPVAVEANLDAALGFQALGDTATAAAITTALASTPELATYLGTPPAVQVDETARTAWTTQQLGLPATYGTATGTPDLVARLSAAVNTTSTTYIGRLEETTVTPPAPPVADDVTVAGQAYGAAALAKVATADADKAKANSATYYLTGSPTVSGVQCATGAFNATLPLKTAAQTCDTTKPASVTATATAVIALWPRASGATADPYVKASVDKAVTWLVGAQQSNGRWNDAGTGGPGDALTTALGGYALQLAGRPNLAGQAAVWLRGQQLANAGTCPGYPAADLGAVALDGAAYDSAPTTTIASSDARANDFRRATARSLVALKVTPAGDAGTATVLSSPRFSKPGRSVAVTVTSSQRNTLCASASTLVPTKLVVGYDGKAAFSFTSGPDGPLTATVVDAAGQVASTTVTSLPKKKLAFSFKSKRVRSGKVAVLKVRGLAPGENVKVQFRGKRKDAAVASASGTAKLRFIVTGKRGSVPARVVGEYNNRNRTKNITVVR